MTREEHRGAGHRQRLRDKFLAHGLDVFTDEEVVELLLALGTPRKDTKQAAREAMRVFGTLAGVLEAGPAELQRIEGIGPKNAFALHLIQQVARRYVEQRLVGRNYLQSSRQVAEYLLHHLRDRKREAVYAIFLDAGHGILATERLAEGTVNASTVYPRELLKLALLHDAAAVVVAHNHPSGRTSPSQQDLELTGRLHLACSVLGINLLDHFIVGKTLYSFADHGLMDEIRRRYRL